MPGSGDQVGEYAIVREIGRGATSLILEVNSPDGDCLAMKLLVSGQAAEPPTRDRFLRGIRAQQKATGTGVVPVLDSAIDPERGPWLTMPFYPGGNLADRIRSGGLTPAELFRILEPVAAGLDRAHGKGVVHRDIKPSNVLIDERGDGWLADFGLARGEGDQSQTVAGAVVGTLACVSPEVVRGEEATPASDRYGFAAIIVEGLTGQVVFPRSSDAAVLYAHAQLPPPSLRDRLGTLPDEIDRIFADALDKDPSRRPGTCTDLLEKVVDLFGKDLGAAPGLAPGPSPAIDDATVEPARGSTRPARSLANQPALRFAGAALALVLGLLAVFAVLRGGGEDSISDAAPPVGDGMVALGSELPSTGIRSVDCRGRKAGPNSPSCTVLQTVLPGARLLVPTSGAIHSWTVRGAIGELALQVIRKRDGQYFQLFRSQVTPIPDRNVHTFPVELAVDPGDMVALAVSPDSEIGVVPDVMGARTDRFFGPVGPETRPDLGPGTGFDNEVLLRVEYEPGGEPEPPEQIFGEEAADLDDGEVVASSDTVLPDGRKVEVHLTEYDDQVWVDLYLAGERQSRIAVPDLMPGGRVVEFKAFEAPGSPSQLNVGWVNPDTERPIEHYFGLSGSALEFYS